MICHVEISDFDVHSCMTRPLLECRMAEVGGWVRGLGSEASFGACLGLICHVEISDFNVHLRMTRPLLECRMAVVGGWVRGLGSEVFFGCMFRLDMSS